MHPQRCLVYTLANSPERWSLVRKGRRVRVDIHGALSANSSLALRGAACAGAGIALLPKVMVLDELAQGKLKSVLADWSAAPQAL
jgi:DNA-binding transcriptional LysR family regulator